MDKTINLVFHHRGQLCRVPKLQYVGGVVDTVVWEIDLITIPDIEAIVKGFGYESNYSACWWVVPGFDIQHGVRPLASDNDVIQLINFCSNAEDVHLYIEHPLDQPTIVDNGAESSSSDSVQVVQDPKGKGKLVDDGSDDVPFDSDSEGSDVNISAFQNSKFPIGDEGQGSGIPATENDQVCSNSEDDTWVSEKLGDPVCSDSEEELARSNKFPSFNPAPFGQVFIEIGMEFPSIGVFKKALKDYSMSIGRTFTYVKNDKERVRARCPVESCDWEIYCSLNRKTNICQVKTYHEGHSCARTFKNKQANQDWLADQLVPEIRAHPNMSAEEAFDFLKKQRNVHVDDWMIYRARRTARKVVVGSEREQYAKLRKYCKELKDKNEGSTVQLILKGNTFDRLYICLDACKKGFKAGCRPLIGLDGCFLKGYYGGQLLTAVAMDANNHNFIIAYAIVDSETRDTWSWFLENLLHDIGSVRENGWNFITDQQKVSYSTAQF